MLKKRCYRLLFKLLISLMVMISLLVAGLVVNRRIQQNHVLSRIHEIIEVGGISELREITLGGISQSIAIEGKKSDNPICLYLHGGPGLAVPFGISARTRYPDLTSHCTAVYWDQRGAGKTFDKDMGTGLLTLSRLQSDAIELIDYLLEEFNQQKLYIIGYSWGSVLGMRLVKAIPNQIEAYFGIGQVVEPHESDRRLYQWLIEEFDLLGELEWVKALKRIGLPPYRKQVHYQIFNEAISLSGAHRKMDDKELGLNVLKWMYHVWSSPDLTLTEIVETLFTASHVTLLKSVLWRELSLVNFSDEIQEVKTPVYFISGKNDYISSTTLLLEWVEKLKAPQKETLILEASAHYLSVEDEQEMFEWIKSIIQRKYPQQELEQATESESVISTLLK